jgi:hypothetical protein
LIIEKSKIYYLKSNPCKKKTAIPRELGQTKNSGDLGILRAVWNELIAVDIFLLLNYFD